MLRLVFMFMWMVATLRDWRAANRPAAGATEEYGAELHEHGTRERLATTVARELELDTLFDRMLIEELVDLRLSVAERLAHFSGRWEREIAPQVRALGEAFIGPLLAPEAVRATAGVHAFTEIDTGAFALPAGAPC